MTKPLWGLYIVTDIIVTVFVIAMATTMIISTLNESRKNVEIAAATAEVLGVYRVPVSTYYALRGEWPKDNEELAELFPERAQKQALSTAGDVHIVDGALTSGLLRRLSGHTITLHPAVPSEDVLGPVKWVAGAKSLSADWMVIGEDKTTVSDKYMPRIIRQ